MAKSIIELSGYSDDCASITGINDSEYDVPNRKYSLLIDDRAVAKIRIFYDGEWRVEIESAQHELKVVKGNK